MIYIEPPIPNKVLIQFGRCCTSVLQMSNLSDEIALETLDALESRLQRIEWFLSGGDEAKESLHQVAARGRDSTVQGRLARLESNLGKLSSKSPVVREILKLYAKHPNLFQPTVSDVPTTLSTSELLAVISSCATSYPTTASRLNAIKDLPIPNAESSTSLIALYPRLAKLELLQESQAREMAELRIRTASAIQRWYELGVLGESECWSEWEGRVVIIEKKVRQGEIRKAQETMERQTYQP
ncbi:hypothetical protein N7G274_003340 [Stereocaulon virgatum]|uniref:Nuclear distribution protein RO10 n=1 Tax=Stereocaulon virgatum TaxID=373712 RepID=A0ABR4ADI8_9LECA